jgi:hypothetical protein
MQSSRTEITSCLLILLSHGKEEWKKIPQVPSDRMKKVVGGFQ